MLKKQALAQEKKRQQEELEAIQAKKEQERQKLEAQIQAKRE